MTGICKDCAFATWQTTPTGKIKRGAAGRCGFKTAQPVSPWWAKHLRDAVESANRNPHGIWVDYDTPCDAHEPIKVRA